MDDRLERQLEFILEADQLKQVLRATEILGRTRRENSAEHSWHLALLALTLAEHASPPVDLGRVIPMLLVHDLVEIDAGDTFAYDDVGAQTKLARELAAAVRIFGLLPDDQAAAMRALWDEFEANSSADARFANALDRLMPLLHNAHNAGGTWAEHGVRRAAVLRRMAPIETALPALWPRVLAIIAQAVAAGQILPDAE